MNKRWVIVCVGILALVGILLGGWVGWFFYAKKSYSDYLELLRARGIAVEPEDFLKDVPDEDNAWVQLRDTIAHAPLNLGPSLARLDEFGVALTNPEALSDEDRTALLSFPSTSAALIQGLRRVAECPEFEFPKRALNGKPAWQWPMIKDLDWPGIREPYLALFPAAAVLANAGTPMESMDLWELGIRSSSHLQEQGKTLAQVMVGYAIASLARESMAAILRGGALNKEQIRRAMELLDPADWRAALVDACRVEYALGMRGASPDELGKSSQSSALACMTFPLVYKTNMEYSDKFLRLIEAMSLQPGIAIPKLNEIEAEIRDYAKTLSGRTSVLMLGMPGVIKAYEKVTDSENRNQVLRLALACRLYYADHNAWPDSLDDLAPEYFPENPADLFTGGPFHYNLEDGGFVIYTTGPNGVDEGGENDDWAWRQPAPAGILEAESQ